MEPATALVVIVICLVMSAFFSGSETALLRVRAEELEKDLAQHSGPGTVAARELLASTSRLLITILIGNNVVNILAATVSSALAVRLLGEGPGLIISTIVLTIVVLIFSEILPKAVAARIPRQLAYMVSMPLYLIHQMMRPIHIAFDRFVDPLVRRLAGAHEVTPLSTAEEILRYARELESGDSRTGAGSPIGIIAGAARAAEMTVSEIMVPRTEIVAFPVETPPAKLLEEMLEDRYTRVPIFDGSIDTILGIAHLKDLAKLTREGGNDLRAILKPVLRVPERKAILPLLADMERAFVHLVIVKDEFGVTQGMVTQEDILEEIVGEIRDEFDREELLTIRRLPDGSHQSFGRVKVIDFNRETGSSLPAEPGDTLSGLAFNTLGHAPRKGDQVPVGDYLLTVVDVSGTRIAEVRVQQMPREDAGTEGDGAGS